MSSIVGSDTLIVHAHWSDARLCVWGESAAAFADALAGGRAQPAGEHPFAVSCEALESALLRLSDAKAARVTLRLRLPELAAQGAAPDAPAVPMPSPHLAHAAGHLAAEDETSADEAPSIVEVTTPALSFTARDAQRVLEALDASGRVDLESGETGTETPPDAAAALRAGASTAYFAAAARFVRHLVAQQRFVPMVMQESGGTLRGMWQLWLADDATAQGLARLMKAMPPSARVVVDSAGHDGWAILESFLHETCDALAREVFARETLHDAIESRDPAADPHVAWLAGLLSISDREVPAPSRLRPEIVKGARRWIGLLDDRGEGSAWRLLLKLSEPLDLSGIADTGAPGDSVRWTVTFMLQNASNPAIRVEAADLWLLPGSGMGAANIEGERIEAPGEVLLAELGRAARMWKKLESALSDPEPQELELTTADAYKFLREIRPLLIEQGVGVEAPEWWDQPSIRLGAKLIVDSEDVDLSGWTEGSAAAPTSNASTIGLSSLVNYRWQIAVGDTTLTLEQFEKLAGQHSPLIRLNGKWVEIRPGDVKAAMRFIRENPGGEMEVGRALRLAYASDPEETGLPILGMEASGWVAAVFGDASTNVKLPVLESPKGFVGTLRPYQLKGLSWLAFLDRLGLGACLADDMGLGKTIQLLALLAHERAVLEQHGAPGEKLGPTLLVVPMSVVPNWLHEAKRFTPALKVLVHHGPERAAGERLVSEALRNDVVVTTYALAHRDRDDLARIPWSRVVLDEAQNIKNPAAKQTRAVREIDAPRKIALTGTPVENRLGELWSIMDFLNGGYLGSTGEFRRKFAMPIERYHDKHKATQLRGLVQPFVLRRLKSDPNVISDLPEKLESKEYCYLSPEQAGLYQSCVSDMLSAADKSQGIQRRGVVLAGLIKLKQICNHPAQYLKEGFAPSVGSEEGEEGANGSATAAPGSGNGRPKTTAMIAALPSLARSGKCQRLGEMLEEVVAAGDKALVFTQFRQMGYLLAGMLRSALDREVLFLHGGTTTTERQRLINEFQRDDKEARAKGAPVFVLSLKAGGVGLNLTAANHVFHFDRWWNPAVEAQATDRAYRIGQTRTVHVHKFITAGTLEERIDQMIESKMELAQEVIGSGEDWLTEMSTSQLRDLLTLRTDAVTEAGGA